MNVLSLNRNTQTYFDKHAITRVLACLRRAVVPGRPGLGAPIAVRLNFTLREPTPRARREASAARAAGFDPSFYSGTLDRVFFTMRGELCFTILCKERVDMERKAYCYRTFNLDIGQVQSLTA